MFVSLSNLRLVYSDMVLYYIAEKSLLADSLFFSYRIGLAGRPRLSQTVLRCQENFEKISSNNSVTISVVEIVLQTFKPFKTETYLIVFIEPELLK